MKSIFHISSVNSARINQFASIKGNVMGSGGRQ